MEADEARGARSPGRIPDNSLEPTPRQRSILEAALSCFGDYGFRRTSMEDIARAAQISRTALYQHFGSKEKLLRALSADLYQRAIAGAADAAESEADLAERLYRALDAKMGFFYELLIRSPHGLEILDDNSRLCGDITAEAELEYAQIVSRMLRRGQTTGELSPPSHTMKPQAMAQFFIQCAEGLMGKPRQKPTPTEYRMRLRQLVDGLLVGFGRTAGRSD